MLAGLFVLAAMVWQSGCDPTIDPTSHLGQIVKVNGTPAGCAAYVTKAGDTLYTVACTFYEGDGWMEYKIREANKDRLAWIVGQNGNLLPGKILYLPPNLKGRPIDSDLPSNSH